MVLKPAVSALIDRPEIRRDAARYYPSVQGLRGLAAFSVLLEHIYQMSVHGGFFLGADRWFELLMGTFGNGVALFFIISGFVIPASLVRHGDVKRFLVDRLLRIMPLFVGVHLLVFVVGPFIGYKWLRDVGLVHYLVLFLSNLTFTAPMLGLPLAQQNAWSLTYEWVFYLFTAVAWLVATRTRHPRPALVLLAVLAVAICVQLTICWFFVIGMLFAWLRPAVRIGRTLEFLAVPTSFAVFYYCAQYVGDYAAIPPAILIFCVVLQEGSVTSNLLRSRAMQFLGLISYSLYLVHPVAMYPLQILGARLVLHGFSPHLLFPAFALVAIPLSLATAALAHRVLEVEVRRLLVKWTTRPARTLPAIMVSESLAFRP